MNSSRQQVLQMLQDGKLTVEEATELLAALPSEADEFAEPAAQEEEPPLAGEVIPPLTPPNFQRYRQFWRIPFVISLAFLVLFGFWLRSIYQTSEGAITFGFICLWSFFMLALLATLLAFLSRTAAWLHVRVQPKVGPRIAISFPLPIRIAAWGLGVAQGFVPESEKDKLEMAGEFLDAAVENLKETDAEPIIINVDDDDGDRVQVYIG